MINEKTIWIVEYSVIQKCFHVDRLDQAIKANLRSFFLDKGLQYAPLAFASSHEEAHKIAKMLEEKKEQFKNENGQENTDDDFFDDLIDMNLE